MSERLASTWLRTFALSGLTMACGAATGVLAARLLMPEGRGVLEILRFWPGMLWSVGMLGLGEAVAHRVARAPGDRAVIAASSLVLAMVLAAVTAGVAFLLLPYFLGPERGEWLLVAQLYGCSIILLNSVVAALGGVDQGELRFLRYNALVLVSAVVYLLGLLIAWVLEIISVTAALWAFWAGSCLAALLVVCWRVHDLRALPSRRELRSLFRLYLAFHGANLIFFVGGNLDRTILTSFWGDADIGLYAVGLTLASAGLAAITISFRTVLFPHLSADTNVRIRRALFARGLSYACLLLTVSGVALGCLTPWLVPLLFGPDFAAAVPTAVVLVAAYCLLAVRQIIAQGLRGLGTAKPGTISEAVSIAVFLACIWPFTEVSGLMGIGLSLAISNLLALSYLADYLARHLDIPVRQWWGVNLRTFLAALYLAQGHLSPMVGTAARWWRGGQSGIGRRD